MTYRFHCKSSGDVLMLQSSGDRVLRAMGLAPAGRGLILPDRMATAMAAVQTAIAMEEARTEPLLDADGVTLRQRALPLVGMLQAALASGEAVVWTG